jgi:hypothetical protein
MWLGSGRNESLALRPKSVAQFYREYLHCLDALGVSVKIWPMPVEIQKPIRFDLDTQHNSYDPEYANRFWQILVRTGKVFRAWAPGFMGKVSPIHFFWGSFDLAVTRFSGRGAPPRKGMAFCKVEHSKESAFACPSAHCRHHPPKPKFLPVAFQKESCHPSFR